MILTLALAGLLLGAPFASAQEPLPPGDPVELILDDGEWEYLLGIPNDVLIFNQFYPLEFPLELDEVQVLFPDEGVEVGDPFFVFLYEDDDGEVANGTTYRATFAATVQFVDGVTPTVVSFDPLTFAGSGQILIAVGQDSAPTLVHAVDADPLPAHHEDRQGAWGISWVVDWDGTLPPAIPSTGLAPVGPETRWMIRGLGTVLAVPVELQSVTVE
jgi:hypothetical protein